jgi:hypothetical protein
MGTHLGAIEQAVAPALPQPQQGSPALKRLNSRRVAPLAPPVSDTEGPAPQPSSTRVGEPFTPGAIVASPFVILQTALVAGLGFGLTFALLSLLLPTGPYPLYSLPVLLILGISPVVCALIAPLFTPLALPEAALRGYIGYVETARLPLCLACLPFLHASRSAARLFLLGTFAAALFVPLGLLVLSFLLEPPYDGSVLSLFAALYVMTLLLFVMPMGVLGFCMESNYDRVLALMSMDDNRVTRFCNRLMQVFCL